MGGLDEIANTPEQQALFAWMVEATRASSSKSILCIPQVRIFVHLGPPKTYRQESREHADLLVSAGLLESRINRKGNPEYWVSQLGARHYDEQSKPRPARAGRAIARRSWRWLAAEGLAVVIAVIGLVLRLIGGE
jgi:hypothetical protein